MNQCLLQKALAGASLSKCTWNLVHVMEGSLYLTIHLGKLYNCFSLIWLAVHKASVQYANLCDLSEGEVHCQTSQRGSSI